MPLFDRYLMIDWSASSAPALGVNSIWACLAGRGDDGELVLETQNFSTRSGLMAYLAQQVEDAIASNRRLLAGFDFAFGYPRGAAQALTGQPGWQALWDLFAERIEDADDNSNNRFEVAGRLNSDCFADAPVYWGHPQNRDVAGLTANRPVMRNLLLADKRTAEQRAPGAQSVWKLAYPGSVGSQALTGIARLAAFRKDARYQPHIRVWPFETGFDGAHPAACIIAEIYPSLFRCEVEKDEVPDRAQVQLLARKFADYDKAGYLQALMGKPQDLNDDDLDAVLAEEGWILGLGAERRARFEGNADIVRHEYIRAPAEIYANSFSIIRSEVDLSRFGKGMDDLVIRLIHACGMVDLAGDVVFSEGAFDIGRAALRAGAPVLCDVEMVRHGIIRKLLPSGNEVICMLNDEAIPAHAKSIGNTRSAAQVDFWTDRLEGAVVAIGNAPTALFRLLELIADGGPRPALVLGLPVGFVGAAESKQALAANPFGIPFISVQGRRGGSAMASAAVNALGGGLGAND